MQIEDVAKHLERRQRDRGLRYRIGPPAEEWRIADAERRLGLEFPAQVRKFYGHYDGLHVESPPLDICSIDMLTFVAPTMLRFAIIDNDHQLCFDVSSLNAAGQWTIVNLQDRDHVTLTMASFWSNKIWHWIDKQRPIWRDWTSVE